MTRTYSLTAYSLNNLNSNKKILMGRQRSPPGRLGRLGPLGRPGPLYGSDGCPRQNGEHEPMPRLGYLNSYQYQKNTEALAKPCGFAGIQNPEVRIQNEFKIKTDATATHSDY